MEDQDSINELLLNCIKTLQQHTSELLKTSQITGQCFDELNAKVDNNIDKIDELVKTTENLTSLAKDE